MGKIEDICSVLEYVADDLINARADEITATNIRFELNDVRTRLMSDEPHNKKLITFKMNVAIGTLHHEIDYYPTAELSKKLLDAYNDMEELGLVGIEYLNGCYSCAGIYTSKQETITIGYKCDYCTGTKGD